MTAVNGSPKINSWFNSHEEFEEELQRAESRTKSPFEEDFVEDLKTRYTKFGMNGFMSDRQLEVLQRITNR